MIKNRESFRRGSPKDRDKNVSSRCDRRLTQTRRNATEGGFFSFGLSNRLPAYQGFLELEHWNRQRDGVGVSLAGKERKTEFACGEVTRRLQQCVEEGGSGMFSGVLREWRLSVVLNGIVSSVFRGLTEQRAGSKSVLERDSGPGQFPDLETCGDGFRCVKVRKSFADLPKVSSRSVTPRSQPCPLTNRRYVERK